MPLNKDWREFLELLNSNEVEYLVIGAFAVAFHGFPRYTADLDLLIRPTEENANRVLRALSEFGFGKMGIQAADLRSPGMVVQLGVKPNRIDLLTTISAVSFEEAWATRNEAELEGVATHFIGRAALLRNKERTGRAKDLGDAEELRKRSLGPSNSQTD
jgi:glycine cleavage system aminomethyltransferase T